MQISFEEHFELTQLYADYASCVDAADWDRWCEFFVDDCVYKLIPRENHERGLPLAGGTLHVEANYAVFRTKLSELTQVFNVGRYRDTVVRTEQGLKFAAKLCVYDSEMIPNSIIYPI